MWVAAETASVRFDPAVVDEAGIAAAIERIGYRVILPAVAGAGAAGAGAAVAGTGVDEEQLARQQEVRRQRRSFAVGLIFTVPLFLLSMGRESALLAPWAARPW